MFNVGDFVGVQSGRDKIRYGTIKSISDNTERPYSIIIDDDTTIYCDKSEIVVPPDIAALLPKISYKEPNPVALKKDSGKTRLELIPASAIDAMGRAFTYGAKKYDDHNWSKGFDWDRVAGSLFRHFNDWRSGKDFDEESGLSNLDHVLACAAILSAHETEKLGNDNRRKQNAND